MAKDVVAVHGERRDRNGGRDDLDGTRKLLDFKFNPSDHLQKFWHFLGDVTSEVSTYNSK